jgi:hypothetical protein
VITAHLTWFGFLLHAFFGVSGALYWIRRGVRSVMRGRAGDN